MSRPSTRERSTLTRTTIQVSSSSLQSRQLLISLIEDERSIANRLAAADTQNDDDSGKATAEDKLVQEDPTALAKSHGNEPSKGAKIDAQIQAEEEAELAKKDAAKAAKKK